MISIIIPMYNSEKTIIETLSGLQGQTYRDFETIVIDDGSTDSSLGLVKNFILGSSYPILLLQQPNSGPAVARNRGADHAQGDIIIFLDSDCIPPKNWIEEMIRPLGGNTAGSSCGYRVWNRHSLIARYIDFEIARRHENLKGKKINTIGTYSACFSRPVFEEAGGFDTQYRTASGEDFDLAFSIANLNYDFVFTDRTFVYHYHPDTLGKFLRQQYGRGYWRFFMYLKHKDKIVKGDSYTGMEAQVQFILSNLLFLSVLLIPVNPFIVILGCGLLVLSNVPLGIWTGRWEKKFIVLAPIIASMRSVAGTLGAYRALVDAGIAALSRDSRQFHK